MNVEFLAKSNTPIQDCFWRQIQYVECRLETRHHHDITETCMLGQKGQPSCLWDSLVQMVQIKFFFKKNMESHVLGFFMKNIVFHT